MKIKAKIKLPVGKGRKGNQKDACFLVPSEDEKTGALQLKPYGNCPKERLRRLSQAVREKGIILPREDEATQ